MLSDDKLVNFRMDKEKYYELKMLALKEHMTVKGILEGQVDDFIKKHGKSDNPQTTIAMFDKENILAVPNIYRDSKVWKKFYSLIKTKKEYREIDKALNMITSIHNRKLKDF